MFTKRAVRACVLAAAAVMPYQPAWAAEWPGTQSAASSQVAAAASGFAGSEGSFDSSAAPQEPAPATPPQDGADEAKLRGLDDLLKKDLAELARTPVVSQVMETHVTTVNRTESTVGKSPAAVFVITGEMIRRSGAKTIPDVLRMVPGVQVARIDANKWAVSARGSNLRWSNKLLVQIDGRTVYTPLYAGVFWDVQDLVLEDIERIEVIRGPGAAVWGSNAVNGVINIITKSSKDTQGILLETGVGTEELGFATARYGGRAGADLSYRVYGKWFERDAGVLPGQTAQDDWRQARTGFRLDYAPDGCNTMTLQGDYYNGYSGEQARYPILDPPYVTQLANDVRASGQNILYRWTHSLDDEHQWHIQLYYDRTERDWGTLGFAEDRQTLDFDFQHQFPLGYRQKIVWGFGYRLMQDWITNVPPNLVYDPAQRSDNLFSYFIQDEITLSEDLWFLTLGSKFEHNDYTNFEFQPTVRLLFTPDQRHSLWGAVSRAVRIPCRTEEDARILLLPISLSPAPVFPVVVGNRELSAIDLLAYEVGYRQQMTERLAWDLAVFFHRYEKMVTRQPGTPVAGPGGVWFLPLRTGNDMDGEVYGFELAVDYRARPEWRIDVAYTFLQMAMHTPPGIDSRNESAEDESPRNQLYLRSSWDLGRNWELDWIWRYVDSLPAFGVPSYFVMDLRAAWRPRKNLELAVVGRNLLDSAHLEFGDDFFAGTIATEVRRSVFGQLTWRY